MSEINDSVAWIDGRLEAVANFPFDSLDKGFTDDPRGEAAVVISKIMAWVWSGPQVHSAFLRFVAMSAGLRPDLLGDKKYSQIASEAGVTKQIFSKYALEFQKEFGIKFARSRTEEGRRAMSRAQKGHAPTHYGRKKQPKHMKSVLP